MTDPTDGLRDFAPGDQAAVRDLVLTGMRERWGDAFDPSANPDLDDIWGHYVERGAEVVVVAADGRLVATGTLVVEPGGSGRIVRMATDPRHRRCGFARMIVAELVERARRRGLSLLAVSTDTLWTSAVALYRSCGLDVVGQTTDRSLRSAGAPGARPRTSRPATPRRGRPSPRRRR